MKAFVGSPIAPSTPGKRGPGTTGTPGFGEGDTGAEHLLGEEEPYEEELPTSTAPQQGSHDEIRSRRQEEEILWLKRCESYNYDEIYDQERENEVNRVRAYNRKKRFGISDQDSASPEDSHPRSSTAEGKSKAAADASTLSTPPKKTGHSVEVWLESLGIGGGNVHKKIGLTIFIGVCAGMCGVLITLTSTMLLTTAKMNLVDGLLADGHITKGFFAWAGISSVFSIASACLIIFLVPTAAGSGVPECKAYLNGALFKDYLENPLFCVVGLLAISLAFASGLPIGQESPLMHISASLACVICKKWQQSEKRLPKEQRIFTTDRPRIMFITVGVACGLAAAFRSPLGGVVFVFEEIATHWNFEMCNRCMIGAAVASLVVCYITGSPALTGEGPESPWFDPSLLRLESWGHANKIAPTFRIWEMLFIIILGAVGGLTGALFVGICTSLTRLRKRIFETETSMMRIAEVFIITILSSMVWVILPQFYSCRPLTPAEELSNVPSEYVHWKKYDCPEGTFNEMASLTLNAKEQILNNLYTGTNVMSFSPVTLLVYSIFSFLLTVVTFGTAVPCGIIMPNIIIGSAYGRMVGHAVQDLVNSKAAVRFYALMGAAGAVSGSLRMPLSITVILMELVSSSVMGAPIMLCAMTAKLVGDALSPSFYDRVARINDLPTLGQEVPDTFNEHTVYDVMTELDHGEHFMPVCLSVEEKVSYVEECLKKTTHNGFPVVSDRHSDMTLKGLVRRDQLEALLAENLSTTTTINVASVMDKSPWSIEESTPAPRVYSWFINMGMRHLVVVKDGTQKVFGMITRHDIYESMVHWEMERELEKKETKAEKPNEVKMSTI